jgi:hypothetical protein
VMESSHAYFDRLCAMAAVNETSTEENERLAAHARTCAVCGQAVEQYQQIAAQMYVEASRETDAATEADAGFGGAAEQQERAKAALLEQIEGTIHLPLRDEARERQWRGRKGKVLVGASLPMPAWAGWAVAAALLVALIWATAQYRMTQSRSHEVDTKTVSLQKEIQELRRELSSVQASTRIAGPNSAASQELLDAKRLQAANESLRKSLLSTEEARNRDADELAQLQERVKLLQSSLDRLQASSVGLEAERAGLSEKLANLTAELRKAQGEMATVSARNEELSQEALTKVRFAERQQKLLATDRDVRDILGARSLHIIDVYDVSSQGEFERAFGRIFYTEGKSLIFYAFDLDQQKGLKRGTVFQAWGQKGESKEEPHSLGAFYMDDPVQNRWVLKVDDSKVLSRIDYVFVTDGARKEGVRPKGKPLLQAFLNGAANHP